MENGYENPLIVTPSGTVAQDESPQIPQPSNRRVYGNTYIETLKKNIRPNPLSNYSSYTYRLSLYMITPDAYDVFVRNGRKDILIVNEAGADCGRGAYLIAQSGGINNTSTIRAPGFQYDFFIDDLTIKSAISPNATSAPTTNVEMSFTIHEQYGFSFITNLRRAKDELNLYSTTSNIKDATNASRQFFVLGIEFTGYDSNGKVFTGLENTFKRYYDIIFTKIDFKIDGRATTYKISAASIAPTMAYGQKRGVIDKGANNLNGSTVQELCNALCNKLNKDQADQVPKDREVANTYKVDFSLAPEIGNSTIVSSLDTNKIKWPMAVEQKRTNNINVKTEIRAQPNNNARTMAFNADTPIIHAIQMIINQSQYLLDNLQVAYNSDTEPNKNGNKEDIQSNKRAKWFNISVLVSKTKWDKKIKDFAFDITYQIRPYETPVVLSVVADKTSEYYGPFKRYEYWLTGKNSEIIKYEQTMNNAYFTVALDTLGASSSTGNKATGGDANIPVALGKRTPGDRLGDLGLGMEAQNNYITNLMDPSAYAKSSVTILGDPDLLSNDMPTGNPEFDINNTPFYGPDGYSLDARSGQTFIEIDFREAIDYDHSQGYLRVNDKILFWDYPPEIQEKVSGIVYQVIAVKSMFRGGKFTQDLDLAIATFGSSQGYATSDQGRQDEFSNIELIRLQNRSKEIIGLQEDIVPSTDSTGGDPCGPAVLPQQSTQQNADDDANVGITGEAGQRVNEGTLSDFGIGA